MRPFYTRVTEFRLNHACRKRPQVTNILPTQLLSSTINPYPLHRTNEHRPSCPPTPNPEYHLHQLPLLPFPHSLHILVRPLQPSDLILNHTRIIHRHTVIPPD